LTAIPYAAEGLAFVTTDRRVIDDLTWDDLLWAFWAGRASQLDWTPINTAPDTRTRWLFEKFVHTQPAKHSQVREVEDEDEVIIAVNRSADAIGYVRANYRPSPAITAVLHDWKWLKVNGSLPFPESQLQWFTPPTYPAMHRLFYVVNRDASPQIRSFLEFVLSDEGQAVVAAHGLTPILDIMQADSDLLVFQRAVLLLELDEV